jgi:DNA gyrase inhibitor GyrI
MFDNDLLVPKNFQPTAPMQTYRNMRFIPLLERLAATQLNNPQTEQFCKWLGLRNCLSSASASETIQNKNPDEIPMEDVMSFCDGGAAVKAPHDRNPDEIPIELLDDDFI